MPFWKGGLEPGGREEGELAFVLYFLGLKAFPPGLQLVCQRRRLRRGRVLPATGVSDSVTNILDGAGVG